MRFFSRAIFALYQNCEYIEHQEQVISTYTSPMTSLKNQQLEYFVLESIAELTVKLSLNKRQEIIDYIIECTPLSMGLVGFGNPWPGNDTKGAILVLVPLLKREDAQHALDVIASPEVEDAFADVANDSSYEEEFDDVFGKTIEVLNERFRTMTEKKRNYSA